jgi:hypothetical protein
MPGSSPIGPEVWICAVSISGSGNPPNGRTNAVFLGKAATSGQVSSSKRKIVIVSSTYIFIDIINSSGSRHCG